MTEEYGPRLDAAALAAHLVRICGGPPLGIIFDCDGVLVDSAAANVRYYNLVRQGLGLPPITAEQERYVQMSTAQQALEAIVPKALQPALREVVAGISYRQDILPLLRAAEGLFSFLSDCRAWGIRLGIHTNRLNGMGDLLVHCGLENIFDPVVTAATGRPKPDSHGTKLILEQWGLPADRLLFVGDSSTDRDAAGGAGVPFLAYGNPELVSVGYCASFDDLHAAFGALGMTSDDRMPPDEPAT